MIKTKTSIQINQEDWEWLKAQPESMAYHVRKAMSFYRQFFKTDEFGNTLPRLGILEMFPDKEIENEAKRRAKR